MVNERRKRPLTNSKNSIGPVDEEEPPDVKWELESEYSPKPPDVEAGVAYITDRGNNDGAVLTADAETGDKDWSQELGEEPKERLTVKDGIIYVGTDDDANWEGFVFALDAESDEELWDFETTPVNTKPVVDDGNVYVGTKGSSGAAVHAIDIESGEEEWLYGAPLSDFNDVMGVIDGRVYAANSDGNLYAIDNETGDLDWSYTADGSVRSLQVDGNTIYIGVLAYEVDDVDYFVSAIDTESEERVWQTEGMSVQDFDDGMLYGTNFIDDKVIAVDTETQEIAWDSFEFDLPRGLVAHGGVVYVSNGPGSDSAQSPVYALDGETGDIIWTFGTSDQTSRNIDIDDGTLFHDFIGPKLMAMDARIAWFAQTPETPLTGETVTFNASNSNMPDSDITEYRWDFTDDGSVDESSSNPETTHIFDEVGHHPVRLEIEGSDGQTAEIVETITVNEGITASFSHAPEVPQAGQEVTFDASDSVSTDAELTEYRWDFTGDGNFETTSPEPETTFAFNEEGDYEVLLEIEDDEDKTAEITETITVAKPVVMDVNYISHNDTATITVNAIDAESMTIDNLWTDWIIMAVERQGGTLEYLDPPEAVEHGMIQITWESPTDVQVFVDIHPNAEVEPDPKYLDGDYQISVQLNDGESETADILRIE